MPSILSRLKTERCRVDGLQIAPDGSVGFAATQASGAWTEAEQAAVKAALGRGTAAPAPRAARVVAAIETWLDRTAQGFGYNNLVAATSYGTSSVDLWRRQGAAFAAWRDAVWQQAIVLLSQPGPMPASDEDLIAQLPSPEIPVS